MARRHQQDWVTFGWLVSYPCLAVVAAMIYLSAAEIAQPSRPAVRPAAPVTDSPDWAAAFAQRVEQLHQIVQVAVVAPLAATVASEEPQGASAIRWTHRSIEVAVEPSRRAEVDAALDALRAADPGVSLVAEETFNGTKYLVGLDGLLTHTVRVVWSDQPARPRLAMVVLGLGDDLRFAREIIELEPAVAVAVLPFRPFSAQVAELARMFEREVLLQWDATARERGVEAALATVPGAIGVALGDPDDQVAADARERGLLVVVAQQAAAAGAPLVAALPLDDEETPEMESLVRGAQTGGRAVALASGVRAAELKRVRDVLAKWRDQQIDVVGVSQLFGAPAAAPAPAAG